MKNPLPPSGERGKSRSTVLAVNVGALSFDATVLALSDFRVVTAIGETGALEALSRTPVRVVVADVDDAAAEGIALLRTLHARYPETCGVLATTATMAPGAARDEAVFAVVRKPDADGALALAVADAAAVAAMAAAATSFKLVATRLGRGGKR